MGGQGTSKMHIWLCQAPNENSSQEIKNLQMWRQTTPQNETAILLCLPGYSFQIVHVCVLECPALVILGAS